MTPSRRLPVVLLLGLVGTLAVGRSGTAGQAVFRSSADAVTVGVTVTRDDRPVGGLTLGDFAILDNGVPQQIVGLSYETQPIDLTVVLDVSRSVTGSALQQLRDAIDELGAELEAEDRLRVLTFDMRIQRVLDVDDEPTVTDTTFASVTAGGSSAVLDALAVALVSPTASDRRQFVVLFSDGNENASITSLETLLAVARRTSPTISVVLAVPYEQAPHGMFRDLALETGGTVVSLGPNENLGDRLRGVLDEFRSSYVLTYVPLGVAVPGAHRLEVRVARGDVTVRARRSYVVR